MSIEETLRGGLLRDKGRGRGGSLRPLSQGEKKGETRQWGSPKMGDDQPDRKGKGLSGGISPASECFKKGDGEEEQKEFNGLGERRRWSLIA